jgi:AcrR family transcriptional regulator
VGDLSLRPLATEVNSSPRVLLFLFGSKAELLKALLARAVRTNSISSPVCDPPAMTPISRLLRAGYGSGSWPTSAERCCTLWVEGYARSLLAPDGPWTDFARRTVNDWLAVLAEVQPRRAPNTAAAKAERTLVLAVLRGAMLDLRATGDVRRTTNAIEAHLILLRSRPRPPEARDIARP